MYYLFSFLFKSIYNPIFEIKITSFDSQVVIIRFLPPVNRLRYYYKTQHMLKQLKVFSTRVVFCSPRQSIQCIVNKLLFVLTCVVLCFITQKQSLLADGKKFDDDNLIAQTCNFKFKQYCGQIYKKVIIDNNISFKNTITVTCS